ncbi:MAG: alpha-galactosidase [Abditibacteriota bacterium]|nr:alpha-galactosidase [Abditibacteriota bacterium]
MKNILLPALLLLLIAAALSATAATATQKELKDARAWRKAHFARPRTSVPAAGTAAEGGRPAGLFVHANHDPVFLNERGGEPLRIGDREYRTGIYAHAVSDVEAFLPEDSVRLTAEVGLDARSGGGSVEFVITDSVGAELYRSPLCRQGMDPVPVDIPLPATDSIHLMVTDGGDDIACDQSDWGDVAVYDSRGKATLLGELGFLQNAASLPPRGPSDTPFFFRYGDSSSDELLPGWEYSAVTEKPDGSRTRTTQVYRDPATGLELRCERTDYVDFPVSEWVLWFRNNGSENTPILSDIRSLDITAPGQGPFLLHHAAGAAITPTDYRPMTTLLTEGEPVSVFPATGRCTGSDWPYFNLETGGRGGLIAVVGWPGQWRCDFVSEGDRARISGGFEMAAFTLYPGEEVRSPLSMVMNYSGDWERAQNIWRSYMLAWGMPKNASPMHVASSSLWYGEMTRADARSQKLFIDRYAAEGFHPAYWWMDAGWYPCGGEWARTGTWEPDPERFPLGLGEVSRYAHDRGSGVIVWFEPERVGDPESRLAREHPEWLLGGTLLDLGDPECLAWLTGHVGDMIEREKIDVYRQDYNIAPASYWRAADTFGRRGMTEIRYVMGYLAYLDALRARFPHLIIDACASGGQRNDPETMRRALPLLRSDSAGDPEGEQNHTYGISYWLPYSGTVTNSFDTYGIRSCFAPSLNTLWDLRRRDLDYGAMRGALDELMTCAAPFVLGDYYPLTPYGTGRDIWTVFQFHRPEEGRGVLLAFRREDCPDNTVEVRLRDLRKDKTYVVRDTDTGEEWEIKGARLAEGLRIVRDQSPASALINFEIKR